MSLYDTEKLLTGMLHLIAASRACMRIFKAMFLTHGVSRYLHCISSVLLVCGFLSSWVMVMEIKEKGEGR